MTQNELNEIIANHGRWLVNKWTGKRADLSYADLQNADLRNADLRNADLNYADLRNADLRNANLRNADLSYTNLRNANLCYTFRSAIILQVGPIGSRDDYMVYNASDDNIRCGC